MTQSVGGSVSLRCPIAALVAFVLFATMILSASPKTYPNLHTILDTSMALASGVLVLLLWDMGARSGLPLYRWLATAFAVTSLLEILHVLVTVEWSGTLSVIAAAENLLRPKTWPPSAYVLPLAVGAALWQMQRGSTAVLGYAAAVALAGAALFVAFQWLPTYTAPGFLGITRPALILAPLLWLGVGFAAWRLRRSDRLLQPLMWAIAALFLANAIMLYSRVPADGAAMVAHLGTVCGYLALLLAGMQMASLDMAERVRAEAELARLNQDLERRVRERTADLVEANSALQTEAELRELADESLRQSTMLLRATFDAAPFALLVAAAPAATVLMCNRAAERIFGCRADEIVGQCCDTLIRDGDDAALARYFRRSLAGEAMVAIPVERTGPDGKGIDISASSAPVRAADGSVRAIVYVLDDVTQKTALEAQLRQAQKMEAIGNLTGGMAHDFNNLLAVIIGNLELAPQALEGKDVETTAELMGEALDAASRGADLTRRLLAFARQQPLQPTRLELNALVAGMIKLLGRTLGESIEISLDLEPNVWPLVVDASQLEAAIVNLATNARDAMPRGGRLMIATGNRNLDDEYAASHPEAAAGDYAVIEVSDTGTGIAPEMLGRIFEPFYTTKERGKGTGLGLSMVFGFVKQSGGHINVYSEVGAGTTFRLYLPRAGGAAEAPKDIGPAPIPTGRGETILVVEDNAALRRVSLRQIRAMGYRVLEADGPAAAIACLEREPVELLFADIVMPGGVDGFELAAQAVARWPALKVVLTSGFPEARLDASLAALNLRLLSKPYRADELGRLLHEALER